MKKNFAFTLAEVLITLGIIGVVASLTIPTLMQNEQKQQYVTALQSFTSEFNNLLGQVKYESGCEDLACTGLYDDTSIYEGSELWSKLKSYNKLKIIKDCGINAGEGCFSNSEKYLNKTVAPDTMNDNSSIMAKAVIANGFSIALWKFAGNCPSSAFAGVAARGCGWVKVDVNGTKLPNVWGRDIFMLYVTNQGVVIPNGTQLFKPASRSWDTASDSHACLPENATAGDGLTCAGRIQEKGWKMDY